MSVEHTSVVNVLAALQKQYPFIERDVSLLKTSVVFDVSVTELFGWFFGGGRLALLEKGAEKDPKKILDIIETAGVTHINFVPSMFNVFVEVLNQQNITKLSSLKYIFLAGEALLPELVTRFGRLNTTILLENIYGPTEGTVYSSWYSLCEWPGSGTIPIGKPLPNVELYILDKYGHLQPVGIPGELCISGADVARGYLNNPELTGEKFIELEVKVKVEVEEGEVPREQIPNPNSQVPNKHMSYMSHISYIYKTGDLARWRPDGNVEFLGRINRQVKIRGFRIELEEIENHLLSHPSVKEAVVTARVDKSNENTLFAYVVGVESPVLSNRPNNMELRKYLSQILPDYMVPSHFIHLDQLPLTSTGKIDRKTLPAPEIKSERKYIAPRNEIEELLTEIWSDVLKIEKEKIGIDDHFFELGGHSLKATTMVGRIHKTFDIEIPLSELFKTPTVSGLAFYMNKTGKSIYSSIEPVEKKEYYPLSSAQERLFVIHQMAPVNVAYNMPGIMILEGKLERESFEEAFRKLTHRHESLRTSFEVIGEEPVQRVHDKVAFRFEYYGPGGEPINPKQIQNPNVKNSKQKQRQSQLPTVSNFVRPFDLSHAPLLRVGLIKIEKEKHALKFDMHHIISDGVSMGIFIKEFTAFYKKETLPALRLQYKEFSNWHNHLMESVEIKKQEKYWLKYFEDEIPPLDLPIDSLHPPIQSYEGGRLAFKLDPDQDRQLKLLALSTQTTTFIVLLALFNILLSKLSNQEDIVVGSPVAGRRHQDFEPIIGIFINTLTLRNYTSGGKKFSEFLAEVKENLLEALENQDYQYENLVEKVVKTRDLSRNSLFDVMLVWQDMENQQVEIPGLKMIPYEYDPHTSKFDITLTVVEETDRFDFSMTYSTALFKEDTIRQFINYFKRILTAVLEDSGQRISGIDILSYDEKNQLLYGFNATAIGYPKEKTIHQLFEEQVEKTPDNIAVVGMEYEVCHALTYRELNKKSNQLARLLRLKGGRPDTITGIMIEPSLVMIIGILAALKAGGAYLPIDSQQPGGRVTYMLNDSQASILLASSQLAETLPFNAQQKSQFKWQLIRPDDSSVYKGDGTNPKKVSKPGDVIYTIYTSGTTGKSKGTLIENENLVNYIHWFREKVNLTGNDRTLLTSSFRFDLGYTIIYSSILSGCELHIIPRETYLLPESLIDYIIRHQVTYIKVTPSLFSTLVGSYSFSKQTCRFLRLVLLGGEEVKLADVEKAHVIGPHMEIMNHYGPTEATIGCVAQFIDFDKFAQYKKCPTIGFPIDNMGVFILDKGLKLVPVGVPGELCVSGAGVVRGYLNRPELTGEKFVPHPYIDGERMYRTGDIAKWLSGGGGMVEFLGRMDSQVKIRGYRIETGEIENQLLKHEAIKEAVVIHREHAPGDKYLCAYIVWKGDESAEKAHIVWELKKYLSEALPDYMIPLYFVRLEKIPLTPNGKLNRKLLPEPEIQVETGYVAPCNAVEEKLAEIWTDVLFGIDGGLLYDSPNSQHTSIGIDDNFFHRGGHSLKAIILISRIHKVFHVNVPLAEIFRTPTIRGLSAYIKSKTEGLFTPIEPVEEKDYNALSSAQKRLYILYQMDEGSTSYNMPYALRLEGEVNKNKLEEIFLRLIARHESLRTSFRMLAGVPVQRIHDDVEFEIEYHDLATDEENYKLQNTNYKGGGTPSLLRIPNHKLQITNKKETGSHHSSKNRITHHFIRPFDLSHAPLLRVALMKLPHTPTALRGHPSQEGKGDKYLLMVDMHHIISDGISRRILVREFMSFAAGKDLPPLRLQYKDFPEWQNREAQREALIKQKAYWKKQLGGEIPVLDLPIDYARPTIQRFEGRTVTFEIDQEEVNALQSLALAEGITLYMILFAIYYILLSKLSNQEDILVGTPMAGRRHADLQQMIGMFVNTLVLRYYPTGEKTYRGFLNELKKRALEAFENQDYPYEELVEEVSITREASRNPLFDTMFVMQNMDIPKIEIPGLKLAPYEHQIETSKFDLTLMGMEVEEKLLLNFEYSTNLFKKVTIERFQTYLKRIISTVVTQPDIKIGEIRLLSEEEKNQILFDFNNTAAKYPKDKTIHKLFEEQTQKTPGYIALIFDDKELTYRELNKRAAQLAHLLQSKRMQANTIVGLMVERSIEMIIGILAILKSGGSYLPIDPDYPNERIKFMLADSGAKVLLAAPETQAKVKAELEEDSGQSQGLPLQLINLKNVPSTLNLASTSRLGPSAASLAYIIYTSGSTGKPKGVLVEHSSVVNLAYFQKNQFGINEKVRVLQFSTICFDASVEQIFIALFGGAALVLIDKGTLLDTSQFKAFIASRSITHLHAVPSFLHNMRLKDTFNLKRIISGGDICPVPLAGEWTQYCDFYNEYGPTETTVTSIEIKVEREDVDESLSRLPVGRPIGNTTVYLLDKWKNPVPLGVVGELYIGGDGVARGYLNNPELTAEKFRRAPNSADNQCPMTNDRLYRTGDLARWLPDGNIEFLRRIDHQVKVRGFRIELGEIENQLFKYDHIKEAVVTTNEDKNGDRYLCAYIVAEPGETKPIDQVGLREYLSNRLPDYMVPSYFVQLEKIPLTPNGKIDRKAFPAPGIKRENDYVPPRDEVEKKLVVLWSDILKVEKEKISIDANFFHLGGHSLKATRLTAHIYKELGVNIHLHEFFKRPTIKELASYIRTTAPGKYISIEPVEKKDWYLLSSAQRRLYILQQKYPSSTAYNIPVIFPLKEEVCEDHLKNTIKQLIKRHESLSTAFPVLNGEPVQKVYNDVAFEIEYAAVHGTERLPGAVKNFICSFDLHQPPLFRLLAVNELNSNPVCWVVIYMHHIISDGISETILIKEFMQFYRGEELAPLKLQYKDYCRWEYQRCSSNEYKQKEAFWLAELGGEVPVLNLPIDFTRPEQQSFEGDYLEFSLSQRESDRLYEMARSHGATLFMILLAVYNVFLAQITHQEDIVVGLPTAGRMHADLDNIIGLFVNTLVLRNVVAQESTFNEFLQVIKKNTLKAFENQEYHFEDLVKNMSHRKENGRNPLFDVMFTFNNWEDRLNIPRENTLAGLNLEKTEHKISRFDLILHGFERSQRIHFIFEYSTRLYKKETIEGFAVYFQKSLSSVIRNPGERISALEIVSDEEKKMLINRIKSLEESKIIMEYALKNKAKKQASLAADFDY